MRFRIGIIGNGTVGAAIASAFSVHGHNVLVNDVIASKSESTKEFLSNNRDIIFICVPTPSRENGSLNIDYVIKAVAELWGTTQSKLTVVIKSTVPVGTTRMLSYMFPFIDFAFCPEFIRQESAESDALFPDRIIIGSESEHAKTLLTKLYHDFDSPIFCVDSKTAELSKLLSNAFLASKVAFSQQIKRIAEECNINYFPVELITSDNRIGESHLDPYKGKIPIDSMCLPKDLSELCTKFSDCPLLLHIYDEAIENE